MAAAAGPRKKRLAEINVTPFVDVMLVLLIIFMVAAPMLEQGINLNLPEVSAAPVPASGERLTVRIDERGRVWIDETRIPQDRIVTAVQAVITNRVDQAVYVRADAAVRYGRVAEVLGAVRRAGASRLHLVTREPEQRP
jgi:biopolymer transport protein TolR